MEKVWDFWNEPEHIKGWAFASDDWEVPLAENDLRVGGKFKTRMQAKDQSQGFYFSGVYTNVGEHEVIEYAMDDGRKVSVKFENMGDKTKITEIFEPENENPEEVQRSGWQAILDNLKKYVEKK